MAGTATATGRKGASRRAKSRGKRGIAGLFAGVRVGDLELLLVVCLFGMAILMRWPNLLRLPHFTDEIGEIRWALRIYRGEAFPLTGQVKYFGPLQHYLLAAVFKIFGLAIIIPRLLICIIGGLTVVLTYFVGREVGGWKVGALGAALLATLPQHIVVNSHVAWQNSTTPFYSTLAAYAVLRAVRALREEPAGGVVPRWARWLLFAGFVFGLMLQTHIGTVVLAPAFAAVVAWGMWGANPSPPLRRHPAPDEERGGSQGETVARVGAGGVRRSPGHEVSGLQNAPDESGSVGVGALVPEPKSVWRRVILSPWPWLTVLLVPVAYGPVIIDNARSGWAGYWRAQGRDYAYVQEPSLASYVGNLRDLCFELMRMMSNPFRIPEQPLHYFTSWQMVIATVLCLLGLGVLAWRRQFMPLAMFLATLALMPRFNHAYGVDGDRYLVTGRYVAFLLPPLAVAMAAGVLALAGWVLARVPGRWRGLRLRDAATVVPVVLIALLVLYPIVPLRRYYTHEASLDPNNATFLTTVRSIARMAGPQTPVLVGALLAKVDLKDGANSDEVLDILLTLQGVPHTVSRDSEGDLRQLIAAMNQADPQAAPIAILTRDECFAMRDRIPLERVSGRLLLRELYWTVPSYYGIYRYNPAMAGQSCLPTGGASPGD